MSEYETFDFKESKAQMLGWLGEIESVFTSSAEQMDKNASYLKICSKYDLPPMVFV